MPSIDRGGEGKAIAGGATTGTVAGPEQPQGQAIELEVTEGIGRSRTRNGTGECDSAAPTTRSRLLDTRRAKPRDIGVNHMLCMRNEVRGSVSGQHA